VSHLAALKVAVLCITHGGNGIVGKAMLTGVPLIIVPWGRDQPGVASRAVRMGVARMIPKGALNVKRMREVVEEVLEDRSLCAAARTRAVTLSLLKSVATACRAIEELR
jgi:UDP:flavonoid glycosyltransferase YjiC (YdhE family)